MIRQLLLLGSLALTANAYGKVGVLLASHGDIDDPKSELEGYIKTAFQKNVGIPFPNWIRPILSDPAYRLSVGVVRAQYELIGPTRYRENSAKQASVVTEALRKAGVDGKAYYGFNFANPLIEDTLAVMRQDGVSTIVVFNKGAQYSFASSGENIEDVRAYLAKHPDWDVEAIGFRQYSEDERFRKVWQAAIERDIKQYFPESSSQEVCVLVGTHGLPVRMTNAGDPAIAAMVRAIEWLKKESSGYQVFHGYLNDDFIPGAKWSTPASGEVAEEVREAKCRNVLMDGRLSFTTHHRATLYDLNIEARKTISQDNPLKPKVVLGEQFDQDQQFAALKALLTKEALNEAKNPGGFERSAPDIEIIKRKGGPLLARPQYP